MFWPGSRAGSGFSIRCTERPAEAGSVGASDDNAPAETVIGLLKTEATCRRGPWRSFEAVEFATLERVDRLSNRRRLQPTGTVPPAEAEEACHAPLEVMAIAA